MASLFKHNKKRNSGLIYEFLIRQIGKQIIEKDVDGCKQSISILRRYYGNGMPMRSEKELTDAIIRTRGVEDKIARGVLDKVRLYAQKLDRKKLDIKKSNLIKEINHAFGSNFFSEHRVKEYKVLASTQLLVEACCPANKNISLDESLQIMKLEEALIKFMTMKEGNSVSGNNSKSQQIDALACALVAKKFKEKYSKSLNSNQKVLVEKYLKYALNGDANSFSSFLCEERNKIIPELKKAESINEVHSDAIMMQKLNEVRAKLLSVPKTDIENLARFIMSCHKLCEELKSQEE